MTAWRTPAAHLCLRVGSRHEVAFVPFPRRPPMFVIGTGSTLVSFTLPDHALRPPAALDAGTISRPGWTRRSRRRSTASSQRST